MKIKLVLVMFVILSIAVVGTVVSNASIGDGSPQEDLMVDGLGLVVAGYPGRSPGDEMILDVAKNQIQLGLIYYYRLHGVWPDSWQDVEDDLLFQVPIVAYGGEIIDPDDSTGGFLGNIYYDSYSTSNSQRGEAHLRERLNCDGWYLDLIHVKPPVTYADWFPELDDKANTDYYCDLLGDPIQMRFFALMGMIQHGIYSYNNLYGHPPYSWKNYLDSGLAPIDENSINPLTGDLIYADGRASNLIYEYIEESNSFYLMHIQEDGSKPVFGFGY